MDSYIQWGDTGGFEWSPLPRVHIDELDYKRFLEEFALPRKPCIIVGAGEDWPARSLWRDVRYFLDHPGVSESLDRPASLTSSQPFEQGEVLTEVTTEFALQKLADRQTGKASNELSDDRLYLKTWDYVHAGAGALQDDFMVPRIFDKSPACLAQQPVFGYSSRDMKWFYIGEQGTGSETHIDTNYSSAWLFCARGRKQWRCVHGGDWDMFEDLNRSKSLPDLFRPDGAAYPMLKSARLFEGVQEEGDIVFNPSKCLHAVYNLEFTICLTHNYVDCSNFTDILIDAWESLQADLLPMAVNLGPRKVLAMWEDDLDLPRAVVERSILNLRNICSAEHVKEIIDTAALGEEEEVSLLLHRHLEAGMAVVGEDFELLVEQLVAAVGLGGVAEEDSDEVSSDEVSEDGFMTDSTASSH